MRTVNEWLDLVINNDTDDFDYNNGYEFEQIYTNIIRLHHVCAPGISIEKVNEWGGEGQGDSAGFTFKITDNNIDKVVYIEFDGYYDSWSGVDWSSAPYFVTPTVKTITVYTKI